VSKKQLVVTGPAMLRALQRAGFNVTRVRGSHRFLAHVDGRKTTVPIRAAQC